MYISINNHKIDKTNILSLIQSQKKLTAIKYVREQLDIGLRESKDIVEHLEQDPTYYDGRNHVIDTIPELLSDSNHLKNPKIKRTISDSTNERTPLIQKAKNNTKTYIIIGLVICIIVLAYFYSIK